MLKNFLSFEKDSAFNLMKRIFHIGIFTLFLPAFWIGKYFAVLFPATHQIPAETSGWFTFTSGPNIILGILIGIGFLIISILIWKIICQTLLIILQSCETYIDNNEK